MVARSTSNPNAGGSEGEKDKERKVRVEFPNGAKQFYEGEAPEEPKVRIASCARA